MSHSISVPLFINPAVRPGLDALSLWLEQAHYSQHAREAILAHAAREGTPTGSSYLEAEDEAGATGAYLRALPAVPYADPAWDDESVILDVPMMIDGTHPFPLAPISGGAPDDGPAFTPTAEDWADYRAHFDGAECLYGYE